MLVDKGINIPYITRNLYIIVSADKYNIIMKYITDADWDQYNQISIRIRCEISTTKQFIFTVFYHKFCFPYSINFRTISFRTCKLALVPTYNYLFKIILVQVILLR